MGASSAINTAVNAGLPAITGSTLLRGGTGNSLITDGIAVGAIYIREEAWKGLHNAFITEQKTNPPCLRFGIDASRSSAIYGASTTVQPPALKVAVLIKHD